MEIIKTLLEAGTAVISDVFDNLGMTPQSLNNDLFPVQTKAVPFAGPAYTIKGESYSWSDGTGDRKKLKAIDEIPEGTVPVWAGTDMKGVCCFGDLLSEAMKARKAAGVVVDGGVRDMAYLRDMGLPMMVRYRTPSQSIGRWHVTAVQEPIKIKGAVTDWVEIKPGDMIVVDDDGVIAIPQDLVQEFVTKAKAWADKDSQARNDIQNGALLIDTLDKYGHL